MYNSFQILQHKEEGPNSPVRLMIAVGVPAFDRKMNSRNGTSRRARLLGVASTDVPVENINKLTLPYKVCLKRFSKLQHFYFITILCILAWCKWLFVYSQ